MLLLPHQPQGQILGLAEGAVGDAAEQAFGGLPGPAADDNGSAVVFLGLFDQVAADVQVSFHIQLGDAIGRYPVFLEQLGMGIEEVIIEVKVLVAPLLAPDFVEFHGRGGHLGAEEDVGVVEKDL